MSARRKVGERATPGHTPTQATEGFDPSTGLALEPRLARRLRDAAASDSGPLLIGTLALQNGKELEGAGAALPLRALLGAGDALRAALPFVHVLARTGANELAFLLPNAGSEPDARAKEVLRAVATKLASDPALNFPVPLQLAFGYAECPRDGADAAVLLQRARRVKWRVGAAASG